MNWLIKRGNEFADSFVILKNEFLGLLPVIALDIVFFIVYGIVDGFFSNRIESAAYEMLQIATKNSAAIGQEVVKNTNFMEILKSQPGFQEQYNAVMLSFALLMLSVYIIYCIFQSAGWFFVRKSCDKKKEVTFWKYIYKFFLINIPWFVIFYLIQILERLNGFATLLERSNESAYTHYAFLALDFVVLYFAVISYTKIKDDASVWKAIKDSFKSGFSGIYGIAAVEAVAIFYILDIFMRSAGQLGDAALIILGILFVMPAIVWVKSYFTLLNHKV